MRLYAQTATIENGFVYLPREAPWLADYLHELTTFPNSKYDDQVDSTSQALDWIKRASRSSNVLNYNWRELALERHHAGHAVAAIAAEFRLPMEQVQRWIDEEQKTPPQEGLAVMEMWKRAHLEFCPRCGKETRIQCSDQPVGRSQLSPRVPHQDALSIGDGVTESHFGRAET